MKTHDTLIPTRFMSTICFLVATIMVFSTMAENVLAALPPNYTDSSFRSYNTSFTFALALTLICIGLNLLGFMFGFSMFMPAICVINIVSHTVGCIYTCVFIMQSWYCTRSDPCARAISRIVHLWRHARASCVLLLRDRRHRRRAHKLPCCRADALFTLCTHPPHAGPWSYRHFMTFWYIWAFFAAPVAVLEVGIV